MNIRNCVSYRLDGKKVWVAGHRGMVGSAVVRRLASEGCDILTASRTELDLRRQSDVEAWMDRFRPHAIIVAAATVGGILANDTHPAEFLYDNLAIEANIIHGAKQFGAEKLLLLGSSCIYPRLADQPIQEDALLTGPLEPTNQWYAVAKIAGIKLCQAYRRQFGSDFISAMPPNLYGPNDNFDPVSSHVLPALMLKAHRAKREGRREIELWGTGKPRREFMYVDDLADALVYLLQVYSGEDPVNVGVGYDVTISELAEMIMCVVGVDAQIRFNSSIPDGTPRKLLDSGRLLSMGWRPETDLEQGLRKLYAWYLQTESLNSEVSLG
ncbi:MAG: GDP-L-fucose synthase [Acetobacteraceae bacterium]|jgi:GDP-L-fucose synthase|nr:wcaG [Rhodopila sp.]MEA2725949.1 GDP-L-fucose synthase [Acetobacteraceae bacterium]MEA2772754.1 GDP-L-fucose synthase [Acetobacteraceae bacterium]